MRILYKSGSGLALVIYDSGEGDQTMAHIQRNGIDYPSQLLGSILNHGIWEVVETSHDQAQVTKGGNDMLFKDFKADIEVKAPTELYPNGFFTAVVSVFNNVDLVNDRVMPGAFRDSIKAFADQGKNIPVVWSHEWDDAENFIGKVTQAIETSEGLLVKGSFFNTPKAQIVRQLLQEKVITEFSFAYDVVESEIAYDGVTELKKLNILEVGPTLKGANPATRLLEAKSGDQLDKGSTESTTSSESSEKSSESAETVNNENLTVKLEERGLDPLLAKTMLDLSEF